MIRLASLVTSLCVFLFSLTQPTTVYSEEIQAGAAKIDITHPDSKLVESPLYSRALIIRSAKTTVVLVTMDVVSIGEIGYIADDFLANVRRRVHAEIGIDGANILINASHCHGIPSPESETLTVQAIVKAWEKLEPVTLGVGKGTEDRIMENRRMFLKDGTEMMVLVDKVDVLSLVDSCSRSWMSSLVRWDDFFSSCQGHPLNRVPAATAGVGQDDALVVAVSRHSARS